MQKPAKNVQNDEMQPPVDKLKSSLGGLPPPAKRKMEA
jgi:hypothetical protein